MLLQRGEDAALQVAAIMHQGQVVPLLADIALSAAKIGSEWKLPLADSVILATARAHGALVWTQDAHFKGLDNVHYIEKTSHSA